MSSRERKGFHSVSEITFAEVRVARRRNHQTASQGRLVGITHRVSRASINDSEAVLAER
jgi:hypothetical protein